MVSGGNQQYPTEHKTFIGWNRPQQLSAEGNYWTTNSLELLTKSLAYSRNSACDLFSLSHLQTENSWSMVETFYIYEGESISNQPNLFPVDRDGHDFHALFQYMFYTWVQNCTLIESFFNKILNVKHG